MDLNQFICPICHGELREDEASLSCVSCERDYAIEDGIPDFFTGDIEQDFLDDVNRIWLDERIVEARDTVYRLSARELTGMAFCMEEIARRSFDGCRILEVGMGTGHFTRWLAEVVAEGTEIYAFDFSWPIINEAKMNTQGTDMVTIFRANAREPLPFRDELFDIVFIRLAPLGPSGEPKIKTVYPLLKPGGWYFDAGWKKTQYETPPTEWALQHGFERAEHHVWQYRRLQTEEERIAWEIEQEQFVSMGRQPRSDFEEQAVYDEGGRRWKMTFENLLIAKKPAKSR